MMMRMLEAGGFGLLIDGVRLSDDDNPQGYFELEETKGLIRGNTAWLRRARGKAVKIISPLLRYLPDEHDYQIILMRRRMREILASQRVMLQRRGEPTDRMDDDKLAVIYEKDLRQVEQWMGSRANVHALFVNYNGLLSEPLTELRRVVSFLDAGLNLDPMAAVVDQTLYRQRR